MTPLFPATFQEGNAVRGELNLLVGNQTSRLSCRSQGLTSCSVELTNRPGGILQNKLEKRVLIAKDHPGDDK